ncbi:MAG: type VI secretion system contractile sheath large subunit [Gammaproteobacteria bacterium]|nr:type VI secretion system contractile sheath large subunit [Gammaproteobacteria bacterium]MCP5135724.1 type VI secretion system contractile sheath large subunit [Gammaproteobacteria bacterium]
MGESIQQALTRVRPPRVKITYDVETGGAMEKLELPFIVGIFADLTGDRDPEVEPTPVKARKLVDIDRDNFDDVLESCAPRAKISEVPNVLPGKTGNLSGAIQFHKFDDFEPMSVIRAVPDLAEIYAERGRIRAFQAKSEASDTLAKIADSAVSFEPKLKDDGTPDGTVGDDVRKELSAAFAADKPETWGDAADADTVKEILDSMLRGDDRADAAKLKAAKEMIGQFVKDVLTDISDTNKLVAGKLMDQRVCQIDRAIGRQLDLILHSKGFQTMEGTWRGMHYLVFNTETSKTLKLRVMNITKGELLKEMEKAPEFDQSHIFKLIYEAEYGTYGGNPYSLLVGDYEFGRDGPDQALLIKMSQVAAAAHAPFIAAAYAQLFDLATFEDLSRPRDLTKIFESIELAEWTAFRESEDSRYVTLAMPRVLLRTPYGEKTNPVDGVAYEEDVDLYPDPDPNAPAVDLFANDKTECAWDDKQRAAELAKRTPRGKDGRKFLWGNPAYVLAERITHAFALYSWTAAIRGVKGGGLVEGLPVYTYRTAEGDVTMTCPTQVTITDRREKELNDLGFMAICHCKGTNKAAFFGGQTTNSPKKYFSASANANAKLSSMLPYMLAASRFAHYLKVLMRERIGSFMTRANVESFLNDWIANYVLLDDNAPQEVKAAYPLRAAQVNVTDDPANPGSYKATVFLKPHFQLEELSTSIRLVADLPGGG